MTLNTMRIRTILVGVLLSARYPVAGAVAQGGDIAIARRIAAITAVALQEYSVGVTDGRITSPEELQEATSFIQEGRRKAGDLSPSVRAIIVPVLDQLAAGAHDLRPATELEGLMSGLRRRLEAAWLALEERVELEMARWDPVVQQIARWRRSLTPVWITSAALLALALWLGLTLGGFLPAPSVIQPLLNP